MTSINQSIRQILLKELDEEVLTIKELVGLGTVNRVFDLHTNNGSYILRMNEDLGKQLEYRKEHCCLEAALSQGVPSPSVLHSGQTDQFIYSIQTKIPGKNGKTCSEAEKATIWQQLGQCASRYHNVAEMNDQLVVEAEFHASWKARLKYNIKALDENDSLLKHQVLSPALHETAKRVLERLLPKEFKVGLVHGDLSPRNTILNEGITYLLDWGTAEINVVPHIELGIILHTKEASNAAFHLFLAGYGLTEKDFQKISQEMRELMFLHHLDKYRWAESYAMDDIKTYEENVISTLNQAV